MKRIILITILQTMLFFESAFAEGYTPPCRQGWPVQIGEGRNLTPAVVDDVDRDGDKEIIVVEDGQYEKNVYMFDKKGYVLSGWPVNISNNGMAFIKTPAVGNIDDTDNKEIITVCAEPELNNLWPIRYRLKITAIDADGRILDGWPFEMRDIIYVTDPVLTDMNNSGNMEIIFGTVSILSESKNHIQSGHDLFWQIRVSIYVLHYNNNALRDYQIDNLVSIESVFSVEREIVSTRPAYMISPIAVGDIIGDKGQQLQAITQRLETLLNMQGEQRDISRENMDGLRSVDEKLDTVIAKQDVQEHVCSDIERKVTESSERLGRKMEDIKGIVAQIKSAVDSIKSIVFDIKRKLDGVVIPKINGIYETRNLGRH